MKYLLSLAVVFGLLFTTSAPVQNANGQSWNVDKAHSSIGFKVKHFFTPVNGKFQEYDATLDFNPEDLENSSIGVTIQVASIDTDNAKRNGHLQSGDFFNAEEYPTISFQSNSIESTGENEFVAHGMLKIRDVESAFDLPFTLLGTATMRGKTIASFSANTSINRNDYGVGTGNWVATTVVSDEVKIELLIEANR